MANSQSQDDFAVDEVRVRSTLKGNFQKLGPQSIPNGPVRVREHKHSGLAVVSFSSGLRIVSKKSRVISVSGKTLWNNGTSILEVKDSREQVIEVLASLGPQISLAELPIQLLPIWPVDYFCNDDNVCRWYEQKTLKKLPFVLVCSFKGNFLDGLQLGDGETRLSNHEETILNSLLLHPQ